MIMVVEAKQVVSESGFRHVDIEKIMVVEADLVVSEPGFRHDI